MTASASRPGVPPGDVTARPVAALDVDGVIVLESPTVPVAAHSVSAYGRWRRDVLIPAVAASRLARLSQLFDCVWVSAWAHTAHPALRNALALPETPWPWLGVQFGKLHAVRRHAGHRPWVLIDDGIDDLAAQPDPPDGLLVRVRSGSGISDVDPDQLFRRLTDHLAAGTPGATDLTLPAPPPKGQP